VRIDKLGEADIATSILSHQVIVFFLCTTLETWTLGAWTSASGVSKSFFFLVATWLLWLFKREYYQEQGAYYSAYSVNTYHEVYSLLTSIVLANLLWCNILSVQGWGQMKGVTPGWKSFGVIGPISCAIAIV